MRSEPSWGTLIVSNVLLTIPVTFTFVVVAWLLTRFTAEFFEQTSGFYNSPSDELTTPAFRSAFISCAAAAGFFISQFCFALRVLQRDAQPWRVMPFRFRVRLLSLIAASLVAAALLWVNLKPVHASEGTYSITYAYGWPSECYEITVYKDLDPSTPPPATETLFSASNLKFDLFVCADLIFVAIVLAEVFQSRQERKPAGPAVTRTPPEMAPTAQSYITPRSDPA